MPEPTEMHIMGWLKDQFDILNDKLDNLASNDDDQINLLKRIASNLQTVLENQAAADAKLDQILKILQPPVNPDSPITPELEAAVNEAVKMASAIDQKVPDKTVPPGSTAPH